MLLIYNGNYILESDFNAGLNNRAFTYGDGLFETIIFEKDQIRFLADHVERLSSGMAALNMHLPSELNPAALENNITTLIHKNRLEKKARIKILVWRKTGGFFTPTSNDAEYLITASPFINPPEESKNVFFYNEVKLSYSPFSKFKTLSSLPYVMAGIRKKELQADDLILFDAFDNVAECLFSNIYWIKGEVIYTPSLETGCKEGIMRKQLLKHSQKNNIKFIEGKYTKEELLSADFTFSSNVNGLVPIRKIEDKRYKTSSLNFNSLQQLITKN